MRSKNSKLTGMLGEQTDMIKFNDDDSAMPNRSVKHDPFGEIENDEVLCCSLQSVYLYNTAESL